jgi:hypothetical protein
LTPFGAKSSVRGADVNDQLNLYCLKETLMAPNNQNDCVALPGTHKMFFEPCGRLPLARQDFWVWGSGIDSNVKV